MKYQVGMHCAKANHYMYKEDNINYRSILIGEGGGNKESGKNSAQYFVIPPIRGYRQIFHIHQRFCF